MNNDEVVQAEELDTGNDDFSAGFDNTPTERPVVEDHAEEVAEADPAPKMAQITEEQYKQLLDRAASIDQIKAQQDKGLSTAFGKIGGIERVLSQIQSGVSIDVSEDDFEEMRKDFPELAAMQVNGLKKVLSKIRPGVSNFDPAQIESIVQQRMSPVVDGITERVERLVGEKLLTKTHKDWKEITANDEFKQWFFSQPAEYQSTVGNSFDPDVVGQAIDTFKASKQKAIAASTRQKRIEASVTPRGTGGHQPSRSEDDDFNAGFFGK